MWIEDDSTFDGSVANRCATWNGDEWRRVRNSCSACCCAGASSAGSAVSATALWTKTERRPLRKTRQPLSADGQTGKSRTKPNGLSIGAETKQLSGWVKMWGICRTRTHTGGRCRRSVNGDGSGSIGRDGGGSTGTCSGPRPASAAATTTTSAADGARAPAVPGGRSGRAYAAGTRPRASGTRRSRGTRPGGSVPGRCATAVTVRRVSARSRPASRRTGATRASRRPPPPQP